MTTSIRTQITDRLSTILMAIAPGAYRTDIGSTVHIGLTASNANEAPCIILTPGEDRAVAEYGHSVTETDYYVTAYCNRMTTGYVAYTADPHAEWAVVDAMLADIRQAIETTDSTLAALVERIQYQSSQPAYHENGGEIIGIKARYAIQYRVTKGDPDSQPS